MIEYLHSAIRATAGEDICICAKITDDEGAAIDNAHCHVMLYDDLSLLATVDGACVDGAWEYIIPADVTRGLHGRFWYCICVDNTSLCFKQPIYLI